jgi:hypothetical protein
MMADHSIFAAANNQRLASALGHDGQARHRDRPLKTTS